MTFIRGFSFYEEHELKRPQGKYGRLVRRFRLTLTMTLTPHPPMTCRCWNVNTAIKKTISVNVWLLILWKLRALQRGFQGSQVPRSDFKVTASTENEQRSIFLHARNTNTNTCTNTNTNSNSNLIYYKYKNKFKSNILQIQILIWHATITNTNTNSNLTCYKYKYKFKSSMLKIDISKSNWKVSIWRAKKISSGVEISLSLCGSPSICSII